MSRLRWVVILWGLALVAMSAARAAATDLDTDRLVLVTGDGLRSWH